MSESGAFGRWLTGLAFLAVGVALLLHTTGLIELGDIIRWTPSLFILLGIVMLVASRFRRVVGPVIIIVIAALIQLSVLGFGLFQLVWPALLILLGAAILLGRRKRPEAHTNINSGDVNLATVMATTNRRVSSVDLGGGEVVNVMGETKLDLRDLDLSELPSAELCVTCVMGQVTLRVPDHWNISINNSTVMGESKDARSNAPETSEEADLTITGTVVMGSLKIDD